MSLTDSLKVALTELAQQRDALRMAKGWLATMQAEFDTAHADLIADVKASTAAVASMDAQVRALTLAAFDLDKTNKKPVLGVAVKGGTDSAYDADKALVWARATMPTLISEVLDVKTMLVIAAAAKLPFVTFTDTLTATIASDLSAYLAIPEPTPEPTPTGVPVHE